MKHFFVISKGTEYIRIPANQLVYISADGNYSEIMTHDNRKRIVTIQIGQLADMITNQLQEGGEVFVRIGRSLIINRDFLHSIDIAKHQIILSDCCDCYYELKAPREALAGFKAYIEEVDKNEQGR